MAYVSKELKARLAPQIKAICKKYGVKASLAVRHHSTLVLNVKSGTLDFFEEFARREDARKFGISEHARKFGIQVNPYHYEKHFTGNSLKFLTEVFTAMNDGNHDRSDIQTDYFDVGWYSDVNIGKWDNPYALISK